MQNAKQGRRTATGKDQAPGLSFIYNWAAHTSHASREQPLLEPGLELLLRLVGRRRRAAGALFLEHAVLTILLAHVDALARLVLPPLPLVPVVPGEG